MLYNNRVYRKGGKPMTSYSSPRAGRARRPRLSLWHRFVLLVGYGALLYGLARAVIYVLVFLERGA